VVVILANNLKQEVERPRGQHHVVDLVHAGHLVGDLLHGAVAAQADHGLAPEAELERVGDRDDLHDAAVDQPLDPLAHRRLGQPDRLADRRVGPPPVRLQLLDGSPSSVVLFDGAGNSRQRVRNIALFGQAVLNGVVMLSYFNQLRDEGAKTVDAVITGALLRLRTVIMTAMLAMLGLLPMALSHGIGAETQRPLAIVIIGGLVSATFLTLIVLPTLYTIFERDEPQLAGVDASLSSEEQLAVPLSLRETAGVRGNGSSRLSKE